MCYEKFQEFLKSYYVQVWLHIVIFRIWGPQTRDYPFPGMAGFSAQNLWYMRQFYLEYHSAPKLQPLVGEISWSKHLVVMARCKDTPEREFYIRMTRLKIRL